MEYDKDKIDDCTLALLYLVMFERSEGNGARVWKGFDWDTMERLYEKNYITDPRRKTKSVVMSEEGCRRAEELFREYFGKDN